MKTGRLLLRLAVGGFFIGHGTQKLFGWFGGHGLEGTGQFFDQLGMRPGRRNALAAGVSETAGGAGMVLGLATPLSAALLTGTMLTAINRVHLKNGPWASNGGYEYNVVLIAAALALAETGPGEPSLDSALGIEVTGPKVALGALALGAAGALGAHIAAESQPKPEAAPAPVESVQEAQPAQEAEPAQQETDAAQSPSA